MEQRERTSNPSAPEAGNAEPIDHNLANRWQFANFNTLLSGRGFVLTVLCLFYLLGPSQKEADVVATVLCGTLLGLIIIVGIGSQLLGRSIKNRIGIKLISGRSNAADQNESILLVAQEPIQLVLQVSPFWLPPLYYLELQLESTPELKFTRHQMTGQSSEERILSEIISTPHRGYWPIVRVNIRCQDYFGMGYFCWSAPLNTTLEVHPRILSSSELPVLSSSQRSGDLVQDIKHRQGDPFDLKAYHPSDGMKKILWKVYAKSGQLISRHPEPSMTPEGKVVIFALVSAADEIACAYSLGYARRLEELGLETYFGCSGMNASSPGRSTLEAEELLMLSVWDSDEAIEFNLSREVDLFIGKLKLEDIHSQLDRIIFFIDQNRYQSKKFVSNLVAFCSELSIKHIQPVFFIVSGANHSISRTYSANPRSLGHLASKPKLRWLVIAEPQNLPTDDAPVRNFMHEANKQNWEVVNI